MNTCVQRLLKPSNCHASKKAGYTLPEMMIIASIIGILAAVATPSFLGFKERQEVQNGRDMVYQSIRSTQMDAMKFREARRFSIRQVGDRVEWASHPERITATAISQWESLPAGVILSEKDNTLRKKSGIHYIRFDIHGNVTSPLGTITLTGANRGGVKRCVIVSTLIGAMRKGEEHPKPNSNGRYCY